LRLKAFDQSGRGVAIELRQLFEDYGENNTFPKEGGRKTLLLCHNLPIINNVSSQEIVTRTSNENFSA